MAEKRIKRELGEIIDYFKCFCLSPYLGDVFNCDGCLIGPGNTPYEGGQFFFNVKFPRQYPFFGPSITFTSIIFHPSISKSGRVNLSILNNDWSPKYRIFDILMKIWDLLKNIDCDQKDNPEASELYNKDRLHFYRIAKEMRSN